MNRVIDLFSGLGGFSAAFDDSDDWILTTVDVDMRFTPDLRANVLDLTHRDLHGAEVVLASVPCDAFSMGSSRTHLDDDGRPKTEVGKTGLELVYHTIGLIKAIDPDWYFIENPMGGMRRELGEPDAHVWWCQYGSDRAKPTDFWGRIPPSFDARTCKNNNEKCHHEPAQRGSDTGTQSNDMTPAERAKIPYALSQEVLRSVENPEPERNNLLEI